MKLRQRFVAISLLSVVSMTVPIAVPTAVADTIKVAVASNFVIPAKAIKQRFEQRSDHEVQLSFASTGKLYAQILHGAPYHVFLAADQLRPQKLEQQNRILPGSRFTYATGRLALCPSKPVAVDNPVAALLNATRISLANPKTAPYGVAAEEVFTHFEIYDRVRPRLVYAENVAQSLHYVHTETVSWGAVAEAMLTSDEKQMCWLPGKDTYQPIHQDAVALKYSTSSASVERFLSFLKSAETQQLIRAHGYDTAASM